MGSAVMSSKGRFSMRAILRTTAGITAFAIVLMILWRSGSSSSSVPARQAVRPQLETLAGLEVAWWRPRRTPKGILILAHGCHHSGTDFFTCESCLALPEELSITKEGARRNFVLVAPSSSDRYSGCWLPREDGPKVQEVLSTLKSREKLDSLPTFALGASSGGAFVSALAGHASLDALAVIVSPPSPGALQSNMFPPSVFVHMPRDKETAVKVSDGIRTLRAQGKKVAELEVHAHPLTNTFLSDRTQGRMSRSVSKRIVERLKKDGFIDEEGRLLHDPRQSNWQPSVRAAGDQLKLGNDTLEADKSAIFEELNLAWAEHEMTSDFIPAIMDFFEARGDHQQLSNHPRDHAMRSQLTS